MPLKTVFLAFQTALLWGLVLAQAWAELPQLERSNSDEGHWAFADLDPQIPPPVTDTSWATTAIDRYVLSKIEAAGQTPNPPATRAALIRRLTYDLTGLPPTPREVQVFVEDRHPQAYARSVDRLLASPRYGERWGRHWLDVVRYADSNDRRAIGARHDITETYRYRDWVVRAFNADYPYNRFMMDQIAGDLFRTTGPGSLNRDGIIATGMLAFGVWGPGDSDGEKMHTDMVDDMINVTTRAFLGLSIACARCHDHKFDPITQADYYALAGIFFSSEIAPPGTSAPWVRIPLVEGSVVEQYNHRENLRKQSIKTAEKAIADFRDQTYQSLLTTYIPETSRYLDAAFRYLTRPPAEERLTPQVFARREVTVPAPQPGRILLLVGDAEQLRAGDLALVHHLRGRGHQVTCQVPMGTTGPQQYAAAMEHDVVLISESIAAASVVFTGDRSLKTVPRPILSYEPYMYGGAGWTRPNIHVDFGLTGVGAVADLGLDKLQDSVFVPPSGHPMALGLSGDLRVYDRAYTLSWGRPSATAKVIASLDRDGHYPVLFAYETGAKLADGSAAPANRVGLFLGQQAIDNPMAPNALNWGNLTASGVALVDAAIEYSINPDRVSQPDPDTLVNAVPQRRPLRGDALSQWIEFLVNPGVSPPLAGLGRLEPNAWGRDGIVRWHAGAPTPYAVVNTTAKRYEVPSLLANTYYGRMIHAEGSVAGGTERYRAQKLYLATDDAAPTNGIISLLFRAPQAGLYDFTIELTNRLDASPKRDPFFHIVVKNQLQEQGRLRGYGATRKLEFPQVELAAGETFEVCAAGGGETFPLALMETDVIVTRQTERWDAARQFHSPNPGSPIVSGQNPLPGNVWEYGYRVMQGEITDNWAAMNPTLFRHLMVATERGPDGAGGEGSGPDFNCWSTPATGGLASGGLALHPAPKSGVGVEWISPLSGRIELTGMVRDLQGIEDGVSWQLTYRSGRAELTVAAGIVRGGARQAFNESLDPADPITMTVDPGDRLRLSIHPQSSAVADITQITWTVRELGGGQREWDLVQDSLEASRRGAWPAQSVWRLVDLNPARSTAAAAGGDTPSPTTTPAVARRWKQPGRRFAQWLARYEPAGQSPPQGVDQLPSRLQRVQSELDKLEQDLAAQPGRSAATILASPVGRLYIELIAEVGPFRFTQRDDKALLPPQALAEIQRLLARQNTLQNTVTPLYDVAMGAREGGPKTTKYKGFNDARIHQRGHYAHLGAVVPRGFPKFLSRGPTPAIPAQASGRKELAEWIADPAQPLPARVMANRIWLHHFGQGLVRTPGNFGRLGESPTHPQLLDYLAAQLIDSGWSIKRLHRQILLSATYRQSAAEAPAKRAQDPDNRLWSRMRVRRLQAEAIRDTLLAVSGHLDQRMGGAVVRMQTPDADAMSRRRALYLMTNRSDKSGFRFLFDAADPEHVVAQRNESTVATQSLFMLNHPFVLQLLPSMAAAASRGLAPESSDRELSASIHQLYMRLFARSAAPREIEWGIAMLRQPHGSTSETSRAAFLEAWQQYCHVLLCTNELIYVN